MTVGAIVVGAGASTRAGFDKVFAPLAGRPVLAHSLDVLSSCSDIVRIVVVLSDSNIEQGRLLASSRPWPAPVEVALGGARRQDSVAAGLALVSDCEWVLVHDAARPLLTLDLVERGLAAARETGAAIAAVPVVDTIKVVGGDRVVRATPERTNLWAVQTPQVFRRALLAVAYREARGTFTDDAAVLEQQGHAVVVYEGTVDNLKLTLPGDLALAEFYLERRQCSASA